MNRILLERSEMGPDNCAALRDRRADHIRSVLRAKPGKELRVGLIDGPLGTARVEQITPETVIVRCEWEEHLPPRSRISLILAMPRPKALKRMWAPLAAMGVRRLFLVNAARVEANYFATHWIETKHYRPLLIEGLQQAGDTWLPEVAIQRRLKPFIEDELPRYATGRRILADPRGEARFRTLAVAPQQEICIAIGPEGGWIPYEIELFRTAGFSILSAGDRILRSDLACIALLALVQERLTDQA